AGRVLHGTPVLQAKPIRPDRPDERRHGAVTGRARRGAGADADGLPVVLLRDVEDDHAAGRLGRVAPELREAARPKPLRLEARHRKLAATRDWRQAAPEGSVSSVSPYAQPTSRFGYRRRFRVRVRGPRLAPRVGRKSIYDEVIIDSRRPLWILNDGGHAAPD